MASPVLVTRAMERVSVEKQVRSAEFRGHADSETAADMAARVLKELRLAGKAVGLECWTSGMSHGLAPSLQSAVSKREWRDVSGLVDRLAAGQERGRTGADAQGRPYHGCGSRGRDRSDRRWRARSATSRPRVSRR